MKRGIAQHLDYRMFSVSECLVKRAANVYGLFDAKTYAAHRVCNLCKVYASFKCNRFSYAA